jgi:hypothetical protein
MHYECRTLDGRINQHFFHKNPTVPMVHSIKNGCKNGKPLTDKFAITMHNAYSLL